MAERLESFEFGKKGSGKYPWDKWMDGSIWVATRGVDFDVTAESFRQGVIKAGIRWGGNSRSHVEGDTVVFQFGTEILLRLAGRTMPGHEVQKGDYPRRRWVAGGAHPRTTCAPRRPCWGP